MTNAESHHPLDIAVVGAGRVGTALAVLLERSGHRAVAASGGDGSRDRVARYLPAARFVGQVEAARAADVVVVGVPDDRIAPVCVEIEEEGGFRTGQAVLHLSGSTPLLALAPARAVEATVLSVHPLQTAPTVDDALERFPGSGMAVTAWDEEGYLLGERLARDAGGHPFRVPDDRKPLYHAAAVFTSNYVTALAALGERVFSAAGIDEPLSVFAPLLEATAANISRLGPAGALTGPAARGDAGTVRRNLEALVPMGEDVADAYVALARVALDLAADSGRLSVEDRERVEEVLGEWR